MEEWADVLGFPDYLISNLGRVYSTKTDTILKSRPSGRGYEQVMLYQNGVGISAVTNGRWLKYKGLSFEHVD